MSGPQAWTHANLRAPKDQLAPRNRRTKTTATVESSAGSVTAVARSTRGVAAADHWRLLATTDPSSQHVEDHRKYGSEWQEVSDPGHACSFRFDRRLGLPLSRQRRNEKGFCR